MSLTMSLFSFLVITVLGVIFGVLRKNKVVVIISLVSCIVLIIFVLFLIFVLKPSM